MLETLAVCDRLKGFIDRIVEIRKKIDSRVISCCESKMGELVNKLMYVGLSEQKAKETLRNETLTGALAESSDQVREL